MKVTATTTQSFITISQCQFGSLEYLTAFQMINGVVFVDTCIEMMVFAFICVNAQFIITSVTKGSTNHTSAILTWLSVQREHHFGVCRVRIAHSVLILYHLHTRFQRFLHQTRLVCPSTVEAGQPDIALTNGKIGRCKLVQLHVLFLLMADFRPRLNDVHILIGFIEEFYIKRIYFVF